MKPIPCLLALAVLLATALPSSAAAPSAVNYQGRFTNTAGVPQSGIKAMSLKIYDAATDGSLLYSETVGNVTIDNNGICGFQFGATYPHNSTASPVLRRMTGTGVANGDIVCRSAKAV